MAKSYDECFIREACSQTERRLRQYVYILLHFTNAKLISSKLFISFSEAYQLSYQCPEEFLSRSNISVCTTKEYQGNIKCRQINFGEIV